MAAHFRSRDALENFLIVGAAVLLLVTGLGYGFNFYRRVSWFDLVLHGSASFMVALTLAWFLYGTVLSGLQRYRLLLALVITLLGIGVGACWEIAEFCVAALSNPGFVSRFDTVTDLIMDALGAGAAALLSISVLRGYFLR